jgi:hypothetical protein
VTTPPASSGAADHKHVVQAPPQDDPTTSAVARVLEAAATYEAAVMGIRVVLAPFKVSADAIAAAVRLSGRRTKSTPRQRGVGGIARRAARQELYYRAAYVIRATARIQASLDSGLTLREAVAKERRFHLQHEAARRTRLEATKRDIRNLELFGPVLGWYLNPLLNNEGECIAANGHNYDAVEGTVIGRPGAVHSGCGCTSGPPHEGAGWVDDAVTGHIVHAGPKVHKLKRRRAA